MRLYRTELFKLFYRKFFLISMISVLGILFLYFYFVDVGDERSTVNGKLYTGYKAIQMDRKITEEYKGIFTDDTAEQIIVKYGFPSEVEEYYGVFRDANYLNSFVTEYLGNGYFMDWNDYKVSTSLYPISQSDLGEVVESTDNGIIFDYTKGWTVFFDILQLGMVLGSVLILIGVSPVFAEESQSKMSALLFTSEEGKRKDIIAKIIASFTMATLIYAVVVLCVFLFVGTIYGFEGTDCMTGIVIAHSLEPLNALTMKPVIHLVFLTLLIDYLALVSLCAITICVSAHSETSFHAVIVSCVVWLIPLLVRIILGGVGYFLISGTPLFLIMTGVLMDWCGNMLFPAVIAIYILLLCTINAWRTYKR